MGTQDEDLSTVKAPSLISLPTVLRLWSWFRFLFHTAQWFLLPSVLYWDLHRDLEWRFVDSKQIWNLLVAGRSKTLFLVSLCDFVIITTRRFILGLTLLLVLSPVKRICVFEHSVMTNFNCACPPIQRGQGSGFLSEGSSWLTTCMSEQRRFWRDCADAQARPNLRYSHRR